MVISVTMSLTWSTCVFSLLFLTVSSHLFNGTCTKCEQICIMVSSSTYRCSCYSGFNLNKDNATCSDEDECKTQNITGMACSESCVNVLGSYQCNCTNRFGGCKDQAYIMIGENHQLSLLNEADDSVKIFIGDSKNVSSLDFDRGEHVYYLEKTSPPALKRSFMVGARHGKVTAGAEQNFGRLLFGISTDITSVSVDWLSGNVYMTIIDKKGPYQVIGSIVVVDPRGYIKTLYNNSNWRPTSLVLNPLRGNLYWQMLKFSELEIWQGGMAGRIGELGDTYKLPVESLSRPLFMAIDPHNPDFIYYHHQNKIKVVSLIKNQQDKKMDNFYIKGGNIISMDVNRNAIYWMDREKGMLGTLYKNYVFGSNESEVLLYGIKEPGVVKVYDKWRYQMREDLTMCGPGTCPFMCLNGPEGASCVCPDDTVTKNNSGLMTCEGKGVIPKKIGELFPCECEEDHQWCQNEENDFVCGYWGADGEFVSSHHDVILSAYTYGLYAALVLTFILVPAAYISSFHSKG